MGPTKKVPRKQGSRKSKKVSTNNLYKVPNNYSEPKEIERVYNLFLAKQKPLTRKQIAKDLIFNVGKVSTYLSRLKKQNRIENSVYGSWKLVKKDHTHIDNFVQSEGGGVPNLYKLPDKLSKDENAVIQFLLSYDLIHGIEIHLELIDSNLTFSEQINNRYYTLEQRKFRIKCSHSPILFEDIEKIMGILEYIFENKLGYYGPAWLTHIEMNKDHEGYKLDSIQRVEVKTILGNTYRLYNKKIGNKAVFRSEAVINHKSKIVSLTGGLYTLSMARDIENVNTIVQQQLFQIRKSHSEMAYARTGINQALDQVYKVTEFQQNQFHDLLINQSEIQQLLKVQINQGEIQQDILVDNLETNRENKEINKDILAQINPINLENNNLVHSTQFKNYVAQETDKQKDPKLNKPLVNYREHDFNKLDQIRKLILNIVNNSPGISKNKIVQRVKGLSRNKILILIDQMVLDNMLAVRKDETHKQRLLYFTSTNNKEVA